MGRTPCVIAIACAAFTLAAADAPSRTLPDTAIVSGGLSGSGVERTRDSLALCMLDFDIALAEIEERQSSFWFRLIPDVRLSASLGARQQLIPDPSSSSPYVLPQDAWRLTLSLSVTEVFNFDKHSSAYLRRCKLEAQRELTGRIAQGNLQEALRAEQQLRSELETKLEQEKLLADLLRYTELLYDQGETTFDALTRIRLQHLQARQSLRQYQSEQK